MGLQGIAALDRIFHLNIQIHCIAVAFFSKVEWSRAGWTMGPEISWKETGTRYTLKSAISEPLVTPAVAKVKLRVRPAIPACGS